MGRRHLRETDTPGGMPSIGGPFLIQPGVFSDAGILPPSMDQSLGCRQTYGSDSILSAETERIAWPSYVILASRAALWHSLWSLRSREWRSPLKSAGHWEHNTCGDELEEGEDGLLEPQAGTSADKDASPHYWTSLLSWVVATEDLQVAESMVWEYLPGCIP